MVLTRSATKTANLNPGGVEFHPADSVKSEPVKSQVNQHLQLPQPSGSALGVSTQHVIAALPAPPLQPQPSRDTAQQPAHCKLHDASLQKPTTRRDAKKSQTSTSSSVIARRKRLQLEAAEAKARIEMELIEKRLEADLADLNDEYSPREGSDRESEHTRTEIEKWLEQSSQHEMEQVPHVPVHGQTPGALVQLHGTIEKLTAKLNTITTSASNNGNNKLLSRLSVPKDLPEFHGDPLEWLQFKRAYEESTKICGFSDVENVWRLRKCLRGAAKEAVSALLICATSPDELIATLELRFGNPETLIFKISQELHKLQPLPLDYHNEIVPFAIKIQNYVTAVRAVGEEEYLRGVHMANIILSKLPTILISKWSDYSFPLLKNGNKSRIDILSEFLHQEAVKISTTANVNIMGTRNYQHKVVTRESQAKGSHTILVQSTKNKDEICNFCKKNYHELTKCKMFLKALRKDRWLYVKRNRLCFKCLVSRHERETCPAPACDKDNCSGAHHRLLHNPPRSDRDVPRAEEQASASSCNPPVETIAHICVTNKVLLKVVPVKVCGPNGIISACALLDDGSTVSVISEQLASRAGLRGRSETMRVRGAWNDTVVCNSTVVNMSLLSKDSNESFDFKARSVNNLNLPVQDVCLAEYSKYNHLKNIQIDYNCLCKPEILIGQDNYHLLVPLEIHVGKVNEPSATRTPLGWCVHGVLRAPRAAASPPAHTSLLLTEEAPSPLTADRALHDLHEEVRRSFSVDALGVSGKPRQNREEARAVAALEGSAQLIDGRWHVGLPWKDPNCKLPDSYTCALFRLNNLNKRFAANKDYASRYGERIKHLLDNNFAKQLPGDESAPRTWYLPHFGVDNPNKKKLRLVFDAAAKVQGKSINDYLLTGPDLLNSLFGIMLRFRENKIGVAGDLKDMFLRIKIKAEDQNALRFLWKNSINGDVQTYIMTSLIFGANCSPFIAQFIKNKNALLHELSEPAAVAAILEQHYMDDYLDSLPDEDAAINMIKKITDIHKQGGFEMRNWTSNSLTVLSSLPKETLGEAAVRFKVDRHYSGERTLGMIWYPAQDELGFDVSLKRIPENIKQGKCKPTKRLMLAVVMSIFDVYGLLTPFTIQGKMMLQDVWRENIGWDDVIPDVVYEKWCGWIARLEHIANVRMPRCYLQCTGATRTAHGAATASEAGTGYESAEELATKVLRAVDTHTDPRIPRDMAAAMSTNASSATTHVPSNKTCYSNLELHVFSDASSKAMCAVAYYRWTDNGVVRIAFIASKGKVSPLKKPITIPKLELQASLYAARLADTICREHKLKIYKRYFWCDSTTVLHWIKNDARNYKTFVATRLGEIDDLTKLTEWRYVPTKLNIADVGTRENYDVTVFNNEWLLGPSFLFEPSESWPQDVITYKNDSSMECVNIIQKECNDLMNLPVPDASRFSSWLRLVRSTAMVLRFTYRCRKETRSNLMEMELAENLLIRQAQMDSFASEISAIKEGKNIERTSRLLTLSPILDEHGILRCGGRIGAVLGVASETKSPVILDGKHQVARLIVKHHHEKAAHGNHETVVNLLKRKYWVIKLRPTVKTVVSRCMFCRIRKAKPLMPRMGDLPAARLAHHQRPFSFCGIDLFGPMDVTVGRRHEKRYGVIFTCLTVRAVHIELVHSLSTDSLIMALRRMASRRGWPRHIMSDNGTNLRGADTELKRSLLALDSEALRNEAANNAAEWTFIPPLSPHWGGAWERLIRSIKASLRVILKERAPKDEVLSTLLSEVENIINSRPLSHVSVEPESEESLTPNHFLIGTASGMPTVGKFDDSDLYLRKQWRKSQRLADMFWKRWLNEVLPDLIPRRKWSQEQVPLKVGDLVLLADPGAARNVWPRGIIQEVFPGADGRVRVVEVRTKTGTLKRSAARVARIQMEQEC